MKHKRPLARRSVTLSHCVVALMAVVLAAAAASSAGTSKHGAPAAKKPKSYVLGGSLILSTNVAQIGQQFEQGIVTELRVINADGGINGVRAQAHFLDMKATAEGGVAAFNELASVYHIQALIQSTSAGVKASAPLATSGHVVMFNTGGVSPTLAGLSPYLFSAIPSTTNEIRALVPYLRSKGFKRMVEYGEDDELGSGTSALMSQLWQKAGGEFLGTFLEANTSVSHAAVINQIRSKNPDVIFVVCNGVQMGTFLQQARQLGVTTQFVGTGVSFSVPTGFAIAGSAADNMLTSAPELTLNPKNPVAAEYVKMYNKLYPNNLYPPDSTYVVTNADAVVIWKTAIEYLNAHKLAYTGSNLRNAILKIGSFNTPTGIIKYSPDGTIQAPVGIWKYVGPPDDKTGDKAVKLQVIPLSKLAK